MFAAGFRRAFALLAAAFIGGCTWPGGGFRANGPEMPRLTQAIGLKTAMVVADVGAGKGQLTFALAQAVGASGHVFSSEIDRGRLHALREAVGEHRLGNVTVVEAKENEAGLPAGCCDAIVMRRVYHHLTDPAATNASLLRALRPGGVLAVIDMPPPFFFLDRSALGIAPGVVIDEVKAAGFEMLKLHTDWPGRGPLDSYCALFRKPLEVPRSLRKPGVTSEFRAPGSTSAREARAWPRILLIGAA